MLWMVMLDKFKIWWVSGTVGQFIMRFVKYPFEKPPSTYSRKEIVKMASLGKAKLLTGQY